MLTLYSYVVKRLDGPRGSAACGNTLSLQCPDLVQSKGDYYSKGPRPSSDIFHREKDYNEMVHHYIATPMDGRTTFQSIAAMSTFYFNGDLGNPRTVVAAGTNGQAAGFQWFVQRPASGQRGAF